MSNQAVACNSGSNYGKSTITAKQIISKGNIAISNTSPLIFLTVQFPQNNRSLLKSSKLSTKKPDASVEELKKHSDLERVVLNDAETVNCPGSVELGINESLSSPLGPEAQLQGINEVPDTTLPTISKISTSEQSTPENVLFTPIPKSVVCTVMADKESKPWPDTNPESNTVENEPVIQNGSVEKTADWDEISSGEEDVQVISDEPVAWRAFASLPPTFLYFKNVTLSKSETYLGVFAKREIPRKAQFGPMEGVIVNAGEGGIEKRPGRKERTLQDDLELTIEQDGTFLHLDLSNENTSNWMRFVRHAKNYKEQNLTLQQIGSKLYFIAVRKIGPNEELKVNYGRAYAKARGLSLPIQKKAQEKIEEVSEKENINEDNNELFVKIFWSCNHCQSTFKSATLLNLHVLTHAADNLETNTNVSSSEPILDRFKIGKMNKSKRKNNWSCSKCPKSFSTKTALSFHLKSHSNTKSFDCPICKIIFHNIIHMKKHIPSHCIGGVFSCPQCPKKFKQYRHIRNHIRRFHSDENFVCEICAKCFFTLDKLKNHQLSHSEERPFSCADCGTQFKRKDKLSSHVKRIHLASSLPGQEGYRISRGKRRIVSKTVTNLEEYNQFVYKCHICIVGFKRRGMLVNHLALRHPEVSPTSIPELNLPILKSDRDYYCQYCNKIYKSSSKRKTHILKNHPGAELPPCSRQIASSKDADGNGTYSQTVGSVTADPHGCQWCHRQYASKPKLLQHQRKFHAHLLPKALQEPKRPLRVVSLDYDQEDSVRDAMEKVTDPEIFLSNPLDMDYELSLGAVGDSKFLSDGEFIIEGSLKRELKFEEGMNCLTGQGDLLSADCYTGESLGPDFNQIIERNAEGYLKVFHGSGGVMLEVWDPVSLASFSPPPPPSQQ